MVMIKLIDKIIMYVVLFFVVMDVGGIKEIYKVKMDVIKLISVIIILIILLLGI